MLQAHAAELLAEIDAGGDYEDDGYLSTAALVRDRTGVAGGEAARRVAEARGLARNRDVFEAFAVADIDRPRVRLLLGAAEVSEELFARDRRVLIDTIAGLPARDAARVVAYWKQAADQRAAEADAAHLHQRRRLHVSQTIGGMVRIDGELDPEGGQTVITALESVTDPANLDAEDRRTPAQRRADALVDLGADHLDHGDRPINGAVRPHVSVVVAAEALAGDSAKPCEHDDGTVITPSAARRIACDSSVSRIVMGPASEVLDVGRATRTVPAAIRRALVIRDGHCQHPGCDRPHRWCDAHHIVHWADGGPTSLDNLTLLCRRHHRVAHGFPQRE